MIFTNPSFYYYTVIRSHSLLYFSLLKLEFFCGLHLGRFLVSEGGVTDVADAWVNRTDSFCQSHYTKGRNRPLGGHAETPADRRFGKGSAAPRETANKIMQTDLAPRTQVQLIKH